MKFPIFLTMNGNLLQYESIVPGKRLPEDIRKRIVEVLSGDAFRPLCVFSAGDVCWRAGQEQQSPADRGVSAFIKFFCI